MFFVWGQTHFTTKQYLAISKSNYIFKKDLTSIPKKSNLSRSDFYPTYGLQLGRTSWKIGKIEELLEIVKWKVINPFYVFLKKKNYFEPFGQNLTLDLKENQRINLHSIFRKKVLRYLVFLRDRKKKHFSGLFQQHCESFKLFQLSYKLLFWI